MPQKTPAAKARSKRSADMPISSAQLQALQQRVAAVSALVGTLQADAAAPAPAPAPATGSLRLKFDHVVTIGSGGPGGFDLKASGGPVSLSFVGGAGTDTLTYSLSRQIGSNEASTLDFAQPGNGVRGDLDVDSFIGFVVVNGAQAPPPPPPPSPPAPAPAPQPPTGALSISFTLTSTQQGTVPFTIGHAFKRSQVPAGTGVVVSNANAQVTPKNTWPDGSLKFAVIAGTYASTAGVAATVTLTSGTAASGAALTTADLKATGIAAVIGAGAFGSATWATASADWDAPFMVFVSGHRMSSWLYRKPIGSDPHLVAWMEVRYYATGAVEVLPWVENGYLTVTGPTTKSATYTFTLGGTQRFSQALDILHHQRAPLVSGTNYSHWLGTDPAVTPAHNVAYLQQTELIPTYFSTIPESRANEFTQTAYPLSQANYRSEPMSDPGYSGTIGIIPFWDAAYITSGATDESWRAVNANALSAGRFQIHYRDESTNRPARPTQKGTLMVHGTNGVASTYTPAPSGSSGPSWATSHCPSLGYFAYLLTGRFYHMETAQFAATYNHFATPDWWRGGANGVINSAYINLPRGVAWPLRTLVQALSATADDDVLRSDFVTMVESTVEHHHAPYVRGVASSLAQVWYTTAEVANPFGFVTCDINQYQPYADWFSPWTDDFLTAAFGYAISLGLPLSTTYRTRLSEFFQWKAKAVVGKLGTSAGYWYVNAIPYLIALRSNRNWYTTWADVYNATHTRTGDPNGTPPGFPEDTPDPIDWASSTEGVLSLRYNLPNDASGMWGNLMPAIAYAVRHDVPGAWAAYTRLTTADNWPDLKAAFSVEIATVGWADGWGQQPPTLLPAYVPQAVGEMKLVSASNTMDAVKQSHPAFFGLSYLGDYSGGVANPYASKYGKHHAHGYGHAAGEDAGVYTASFTANGVTFERTVGTPDLTALGKYVNYGDGTFGTSYGYFIAKGAASTDWNNPNNSAAWALADTPDANPREITPNNPGGAHTYDNLHILPPKWGGDPQGGFLRPGAFAIGSVVSRETKWSHNLRVEAGTWERFTAGPSTNLNLAGSLDTRRGRWKAAFHRGYLNVKTRAFVEVSGGVSAIDFGYQDLRLNRYHYDRDIHVFVTNTQAEAVAGNASRWYWWAAGDDVGTRTAVTWTGSAPPSTGRSILGNAEQGAAVCYVPDTGQFFYYSAQTPDSYYLITVPSNPATAWTSTPYAITGTGRPSLLTSPCPPHKHIYGRMDYLPGLKSISYIPLNRDTGLTTDRVALLRLVA